MILVAGCGASTDVDKKLNDDYHEHKTGARPTADQMKPKIPGMGGPGGPPPGVLNGPPGAKPPGG